MLGPIVDVSRPCTAPERIVLHGTHVDLIPWEHSHAEEIWPLLEGPQNESVWKYWPDGPFPDFKAYNDAMSLFYNTTDPLFWAMVDPKSGKCQGQAILGEVDLQNRHIEAGMFVTMPMQKTTACTEAFYLIACQAFDLGFRRLAWKTNSVNLKSRRAAERYGYTLEGIFRQDKIEKGRSRDTAWFGMIDKEWPIRKLAFQKWLQSDNFDTEGRQKRDLVSIRRQLEADGSL